MSGAPRLTRKLVLEERVDTPDGGGGVVDGWVGLGSHWAAIRAISVREVMAGERPVSRITHELTIRAAPEGSPRRPSAHQRFRLGGRIFAIRGIAEADPERAYLRVWVEEGGAS